MIKKEGLPDDFVFCDMGWYTAVPGQHRCAEHKPGHTEHRCCCGSVYQGGEDRG